MQKGTCTVYIQDEKNRAYRYLHAKENPKHVRTLARSRSCFSSRALSLAFTLIFTLFFLRTPTCVRTLRTHKYSHVHARTLTLTICHANTGTHATHIRTHIICIGTHLRRFCSRRSRSFMTLRMVFVLMSFFVPSLMTSSHSGFLFQCRRRSRDFACAASSERVVFHQRMMNVRVRILCVQSCMQSNMPNGARRIREQMCGLSTCWSVSSIPSTVVYSSAVAFGWPRPPPRSCRTVPPHMFVESPTRTSLPDPAGTVVHEA